MDAGASLRVAGTIRNFSSKRHLSLAVVLFCLFFGNRGQFVLSTLLLLAPIVTFAQKAAEAELPRPYGQRVDPCQGNRVCFEFLVCGISVFHARSFTETALHLHYLWNDAPASVLVTPAEAVHQRNLFHLRTTTWLMKL
jgi:hypothetical protein